MNYKSFKHSKCLTLKLLQKATKVLQYVYTYIGFKPLEDLKLSCRIVSSKRFGIPIDTMASHVSTKIHNTPNVQFNNNKTQK